jgi:2-phospho-L-lactate guanylyltransferase (CobY/MobA/RfbA family)
MLADALERTRAILNKEGSVVFLGMDAPEVPVEEIITALTTPTHAVLCPAEDGGYGMLSVPPHAPCPQIFQNIPWSQSLTAVSQLKALTDCDINVRLGRLMHDMDEPEDVQKLVQRSCRARNYEDVDQEESQGNNSNVLLMSSGLCQLPPANATCEHTWNALVSLGLIESKVVEESQKYRIREDAFAW